MNKKIKTILALLMIAAMTFTFCACGSSDETTTPDSDAAAAEEQTPDADASGEAEAADVSEFEGEFADSTDEGHNSVTNTLQADGTYSCVISIFRLCELTGTGTAADGVLTMDLEDPSGNPMKAEFSAGEGGYDLTITDSTWSLLESGTVFYTFIPM